MNDVVNIRKSLLCNFAKVFRRKYLRTVALLMVFSLTIGQFRAATIVTIYYPDFTLLVVKKWISEDETGVIEITILFPEMVGYEIIIEANGGIPEDASLTVNSIESNAKFSGCSYMDIETVNDSMSTIHVKSDDACHFLSDVITIEIHFKNISEEMFNLLEFGGGGGLVMIENLDCIQPRDTPRQDKIDAWAFVTEDFFVTTNVESMVEEPKDFTWLDINGEFFPAEFSLQGNQLQFCLSKLESGYYLLMDRNSGIVYRRIWYRRD